MHAQLHVEADLIVLVDSCVAAWLCDAIRSQCRGAYSRIVCMRWHYSTAGGTKLNSDMLNVNYRGLMCFGQY